MANNRINLICNKCGSEFAIAKWYPGSAWYTNRETNDTYNEWLEAHNHESPCEPFRLEYEQPISK